MKVTSIKPQVKRTNRYSIFIDGKYSFSLSEAELIDLSLRVGQELETKDIDKLNSEVVYGNARNQCFKLLSYRARSTGEIRDYLKRKKYENEIIDRVVDFLTDRAFLNDEQFARQWIDNRLSIKQSSVRQIKMELRQKKVSSDIIDKVITDLPIDESKILEQLIAKKRTQPKYQEDIKLMQYLGRKGFSYDKILIALGRRAE
jgi:regulatory protein